MPAKIAYNFENKFSRTKQTYRNQKQEITTNLKKLKDSLDPVEVNPKRADEIALKIKINKINQAIKLLNELKSKIKGNIIIVSGPSGVGKDTVIKELLAKRPEINTVVSHTTRLPREKDGEKNGISYYFVQGKNDAEKESAFKKLIPDMFQWAKIGKFYYGSTLTELAKKQQGHDVCLNIFASDALRIKNEQGKKAVTIFLSPGEKNEEADLKELSRRILARNPMGTDELQDRLNKAKEQFALKPLFDFAINNPRNENKEAKSAAIETEKAILSKRNPAFKIIDDIKIQLNKLLSAESGKEKKAA